MASHLLSRRVFLKSSLMVGASLSVGLVAACTGTAPTAAPTSAPASGAAQTAPAGGAPAKELTLTAWFTDRRSINDMTEKQAMPEFMARNPGIKVDVQFVPEAQIQQKLLAAKQANNAPDLTAIDETFEDTLWKNKALLPIPQSVLNVREEMGAKVADLYKLPPEQAQGEYFGLPNGQFGGVLYYNPALLAELKYTPEQIPTKWDDFIKWARDITVWKGSTLDRSGFTIYGNEDGLRNEYRVQMGGWQDGNMFPTKDQVLLARDLEYDAVKWLLDMYDVHKLDARDGVTYQEKFGSGRAVTTFAWTWNNGFFETQYKMDQYGTKRAPAFDPTKANWPQGLSGPDVGFCVTTQSTNQAQVDAAWKLYRYLVGPDYLKRYCTLRGVQPSLKSMWTAAEFSEEKGGVKWAPLANKMKPGNNLDYGFNSIELNTILARPWVPIRDEKADPKAVLSEVEKAANEYLKANPQWSILSAADYKAHPEWMQAQG
jgi:ABC-type glycerol-3-phosphate transport system substrate-binding protein